MNKSETELANVNTVIADMPEHERVLCQRMIDSLMLSVGHPITGNTFMMAIAQVNCQIAVNAIRLGVVDENGAFISRADRPEQKSLALSQPAEKSPKPTRLSIFPTDPAHDEALNKKARVLLDGKTVDYCVVADENEGYISRYIMLESGRFEEDIDGEPKVETIHGKVNIIIPD